MKIPLQETLLNSVKNILTPKIEKGKGLQIIENISKEDADRILRKGVHNENILTPKVEQGKALEIIKNISKEDADRILRKGKGFHFENI